MSQKCKGIFALRVQLNAENMKQIVGGVWELPEHFKNLLSLLICINILKITNTNSIKIMTPLLSGK